LQVTQKYEIREKLQDLVRDRSSAEQQTASILFLPLATKKHGDNSDDEEERKTSLDSCAESGDSSQTLAVDEGHIDAQVLETEDSKER
jgi:hypothetical protein